MHDPEFDQLLSKFVDLSQPNAHRNVFYGVCIPARLALLALLSWLIHKHAPVARHVCLAMAIAVIVHYVWQTRTDVQWWSKRVELSYAIIALALIVGDHSLWYVAALFGLSIVGGIAQALIFSS